MAMFFGILSSLVPTLRVGTPCLRRSAARDQRSIGRNHAGSCRRAAGRAFPRGAWERETRTLPTDEFLQRVTIRRHQAAVAPAGQDDFGDVNVAVRIDADAVRREKVPRRARILTTAPACLQLP